MRTILEEITMCGSFGTSNCDGGAQASRSSSAKRGKKRIAIQSMRSKGDMHEIHKRDNEVSISRSSITIVGAAGGTTGLRQETKALPLSRPHPNGRTKLIGYLSPKGS
jgi:hypothetical protein